VSAIIHLLKMMRTSCSKMGILWKCKNFVSLYSRYKKTHKAGFAMDIRSCLFLSCKCCRVAA